jgi:hypothetical protein
LAKPKERTLNRPEEAPSPERFQLGIVSEISSEWWAISFRNRGRFKIGMVGDFARNQHFGVMTGNMSDLRTGLPRQTVMRDGRPYHEPMRLIALIEAPLDFAGRALQSVAKVKNLVHGGWIRAIVIDPTQGYKPFVFNDGEWEERPPLSPSAE